MISTDEDSWEFVARLFILERGLLSKKASL
jgi:hypothetical protein